MERDDYFYMAALHGFYGQLLGDGQANGGKEVRV